MKGFRRIPLSNKYQDPESLVNRINIYHTIQVTKPGFTTTVLCFYIYYSELLVKVLLHPTTVL